jgi:sialidase-1
MIHLGGINRFVALAAILAMGCGTCVGLESTADAQNVAPDRPDTRLTAVAGADPSWQALGGSVTADPSAAADPDDPTGVYAFVRGGDNALYWNHEAGDTWSGYQAAGGFLTSQPFAVADRTGVSGAPGAYVFVRGGDGALYFGRVSGGAWQGWQALGGYLDFFATAAVDPTGLWVGVRGGDGGLYARRLSGGVWSPWQAFGGFLNSAPWLVGDSSGVYGFVTGDDSALYSRNLAGGDWLGLGGSVTSVPVATADAAGISVLVRGSDGGAYWRHASGGVWAPFQNLGGFLTSPPLAVADTGGVSVYVRGGDGGLYRNRFDGTSWNGWSALGGYLASSPAPASDRVGFDHVLVVGGDAGLYAMSVAGTAIGAPPLISTSPSLYPSFSAAVHDYVSRCSGSTPVQVSVQAPSGTTVSVDGQPAASGAFTVTVTREVGQSFTIVVQAESQPPDTYYVRCLPADFPTWTVQQSGPTQAEYYVMGGAFAKYVAIVDTNGVPVWWDVPPNRAVFAQLLPDGQFGWITLNGTAQELPLTGAPIHTIAGPVAGSSFIDNHDLLQLPNGHHVVVVNKAVPNVDLSEWGAGFTTGPVLDHVFEELDASGTVVWSWDVIDHIPVSETDVQWRGATAGCPVGTCYDPYHWNSIEETATGYILSFRHLDAIYNIDKATGNITWKLGGSTRAESLSIVNDPVFSGGSHFGGQHDARVLADGTVTLHDNGSGLGRAPRAVRYQISTAAKTATLVEQLSDPALVSNSICCGSARKLPGGNWVFGWGGTNFVTEMTSSGVRVFLLQLTSSPFVYRAIPVPFGQLDRATLRADMDANPSLGVAAAASIPPPPPNAIP